MHDVIITTINSILISLIIMTLTYIKFNLTDLHPVSTHSI